MSQGEARIPKQTRRQEAGRKARGRERNKYFSECPENNSWHRIADFLLTKLIEMSVCLYASVFVSFAVSASLSLFISVYIDSTGSKMLSG